MNYYFFLFLFLVSNLFSADTRFSSSAHARHQSQFEHFQSVRDQHKSWTEQPYMTGNWGGIRNSLADYGLTIGSSFVTDILMNVFGGRSRGIAYAGSLGVDLNYDFSKRTSLQDFHFYTSFVWRTGTNLSEEKIGNQFNVAQVYGGQNVRLNELYLRKGFLDQKIWLKAGRLDTGNDFLQSDLYSYFVNNGFNGNPVAVFLNIPSFTAYPNATWGAFLLLQTSKRHWQGKIAVYNANPDVVKNRYHGFNFSFGGPQGALIIGEGSYQHQIGRNERGKPGHYRLGYIYQTGSAEKFSGEKVDGNLTLYIQADQMILQHSRQSPERGLIPFIAYLYAPTDRNLIPHFICGGLVYKGIWDTRPKDVTSLGFVYGRYSGDLREIQKKNRSLGITTGYGKYPQTYEAIIELNHLFQLTPWFYVEPDLQFVLNPKGQNRYPNALVLGAQIGIIF